jgi:hypothetical protein
MRYNSLHLHHFLVLSQGHYLQTIRNATGIWQLSLLHRQLRLRQFLWQAPALKSALLLALVMVVQGVWPENLGTMVIGCNVYFCASTCVGHGLSGYSCQLSLGYLFINRIYVLPFSIGMPLQTATPVLQFKPKQHRLDLPLNLAQRLALPFSWPSWPFDVSFDVLSHFGLVV